MKPTVGLSLVLSFLLTLGSALAQQTDEATAAIEDLGQQWQDLYGQGDAAAIAELYTEDAAFYDAFGGVHQGREAIQAAVQDNIDQGATEITIEQTETEVTGDIAHGIGRYTLLSADGQTVGEGYYLTILHRMDGQWMIHRHLSNMIMPAMEEGGATGGASQSADDAKIADARRAGPASIAEGATIMDWPSTEGGEMTMLREGTNGWVCYPTNPAVLALGFEDPMCLDEVWQGWLDALLTGESPTIERLGVAYMLRGDGGASNVDPFATGPEDDPTWHVAGPHIMLLMPGLNYEGVSTDHTNGGPYVMWADTPYAHIMIPVADAEHH